VEKRQVNLSCQGDGVVDNIVKMCQGNGGLTMKDGLPIPTLKFEADYIVAEC